jgi:hypothetical protein
MDARSLIILRTNKCVDALFSTVRAMPEDKLDWQPMGIGRSALDQVRECAQAPSWFSVLLAKREFVFDQERYQEMVEERSQWDLDTCEKLCRKNTKVLAKVIQGFPEEDMLKTMSVPLAENLEWSFFDIMNLHYWNTVYHIGQINYIQTLYGDKEMH